MARSEIRYSCQQCGYTHMRWAGRCDGCGAWNSIVEERAVPGETRHRTGRKRAEATRPTPLSEIGAGRSIERISSGVAEFDRVLGFGLAAGSVVLIGGDPGIGKSTLLLQAAAYMGKVGPVVYVTGEEAIEQIGLRASRLGLASNEVGVLAETSLERIIESLSNTDGLICAIIDSIQTVHTQDLDAAPGAVAQLRWCAQRLVELARRKSASVLLIGHVTKDGVIAGPRVVEHMVDTVLYFEGDRSHHFRILRAVKNRYGAVDEIGVFEMTGGGLTEVPNPSLLFLGPQTGEAPGRSVFAGIEGTRPVLVEVQALTAPNPHGSPRRSTVGWDSARLAMLLAVLETHCGVTMHHHDVYLNVTGGLRISEPAADLAVASALISARFGLPVPEGTVFFGEVGLSGEIRRAPRAELRLREAGKLGFSHAVIPSRVGSDTQVDPRDDATVQCKEIIHLRDLAALSAPSIPAGSKRISRRLAES